MKKCKLLTIILYFSLTPFLVFAKPLCIAHRGYHTSKEKFPENSLAAVIAAEKIGADGVEVDIHHTKDGIAILNHDKTLGDYAQTKQNSTTPCPVETPIAELYISELSSCVLLNNEDIPTLDQLFSQILTLNQSRPFKLSLEFKDPAREKTLDKLNWFLEQAPCELLSFKSSILHEIQESSCHISLNTSEIVDLALFSTSGRGKGFGYGLGFDDNISKVYFNYSMVGHEFIEQRLDKELFTGVWTVNKTATLKSLVNLAFKYPDAPLSIVSNYPNICIEERNNYLLENN